MASPTTYKRETLLEEYGSLSRSGSKSREFQSKCICFLEKNDVNSAFKLLPISDMAREFLKFAKEEQKEVKFAQLEKILSLLEKYAVNILNKPWCHDIYTVKVYTGFFKYNFDQWISRETTCRVLAMLGYRESRPGLLTLRNVHVDRICAVGFELYLGHTQFNIFRNSKCLDFYHVDDVVQAWLHMTGRDIDILAWLEKKFSDGRQSRMSDMMDPRYSGEYDEVQRWKSVNTHVEHRNFDKDGRERNDDIKYPPNYANDLEPNFTFSGNSKNIPEGKIDNRELMFHNSEHDRPSVPVIDFSDDNLYGHEEDVPFAMPRMALHGHDEKNKPFSMPNMTLHDHDEKNVLMSLPYMTPHDHDEKNMPLSLPYMTVHDHDEKNVPMPLPYLALHDYDEKNITMSLPYIVHEKYVPMSFLSKVNQVDAVKHRKKLKNTREIFDGNLYYDCDGLSVKSERENRSQSISSPLSGESVVARGGPVYENLNFGNTTGRENISSLPYFKDANSVETRFDPSLVGQEDSSWARQSRYISEMLKSRINDSEKYVKLTNSRKQWPRDYDSVTLHAIANTARIPRTPVDGSNYVGTAASNTSCSICGSWATAGCKVCRMDVCNGCLGILRKRPCTGDVVHKMFKIPGS